MTQNTFVEPPEKAVRAYHLVQQYEYKEQLTHEPEEKFSALQTWRDLNLQPQVLEANQKLERLLTWVLGTSQMCFPPVSERSSAGQSRAFPV